MEKRILHNNQQKPYQKHETGKQSELEACQYLQAQGLELIAKNYHCYYGEIDLIMQDQEDIVFVEVRCRHSTRYGNALESVSKAKIAKIIKSATHFMQKKKWLNIINSRFDIIAIQPVAGRMQLEWVKNAFSVES